MKSATQLSPPSAGEVERSIAATIYSVWRGQMIRNTIDAVLDGELLGVVMPFCFESVHGMLSLISTTTIFGTPVDVTLQELAVESFFPADDFTAQVLRKIAQENPGVAEG